MPAGILLIEDDFTLSQGLQYLLKHEGYIPDPAYTAEQGLSLADSNSYSLIICDRMLPGMDGLEVLRRLRNRGDRTKLLFLTARDTVQEKVEGLNVGADDYITKPFDTDELLARIRVLLRRPGDEDAEDGVRFADLTMGAGDNLLFCGDQYEALTPKERQLMSLFLAAPGQVQNRKTILEEIWGTSSYIEENNIDICVHHLRKKISKLGSAVCIRTVRGVGYTLEASPEN